MKVVFLDIDGVLATPRQYATRRNKLHSKDRHAQGLNIPYMWDERCVIAFNRFLRINDVEIVLSSDWRTHFTMDEMDMICKINGLARSPISFTPVLHKEDHETLGDVRSREIQTWLQNNKVAMWCAIDDMELAALGDKAIKTDERMGMGEWAKLDMLEGALFLLQIVNNL